jgi:hypothetical protein
MCWTSIDGICDKNGRSFGPAAILASGQLDFQGWMVMRFGTKRRFRGQ